MAEDHDLLIRLDERLGSITTEISEIKQLLKTLPCNSHEKQLALLKKDIGNARKKTHGIASSLGAIAGFIGGFLAKAIGTG